MMIRVLFPALLLSLLLTGGCAATVRSVEAQPAQEFVQATVQTAAAAPPGFGPESGAEAEFLLRVPEKVGDGEAFIVEIEAPGTQKVELVWRGRTLTLPAPDHSGVFTALLAVPLDEKAGSLPLAVTAHFAGGRRESFSADIAIDRRSYPIQRLTVEQKFVSPPKDMEEKIKRDRAEMRAAVSTFSARRYWDLPMQRPVPGAITSQYGLRRVFNEQARNPHRGLDLRGGEGDPVFAADDGMAVLVANHYYGGKTVVIDHGLGVLTAYLHLSGFKVRMGQRVRRGDVIGFVGSTGRVTAPHLHLSLYVMGESINPLPLLAKE